MNSLPASIEAYLSDAGFSGTEILVLRKLLEGEAMTLRELAAKTGKSTGVLDQATKKLLNRHIISRESVNDTPKFFLKSLDAIMQWMQEDTEEKQKHIQSRAKDFESFIASLKQESKRPEMEYFEGEEGIKKAYVKLLGIGEKEMLCFVPATVKEEEDPLCAFRVQYFRERRKRGIFARVLSQNTPLGRRYHSRDAFEYRQTVLVPEETYPLSFEKIIVDGTIACFNHAEKRVCFLHYPELAETERRMFEVLWRRSQELPTQAKTVAVTLPAVSQPVIPFSTKTFSSLREFFLSRKSLALFTTCAVLAAGITYGLYRHNIWINTERIRERAMAIAATGAMELDPKDIDQLHTAEDVEKPEFMKLVEKLRLIKSRNQNVMFAYIDRPTGLENPAWEVVADADFGTPDKDLNDNGSIEESEQLTIPGQKYPHADPLLEERLKGPTTDFVKDEWGEYYDTSAPIFDSQGKAVAALFVDINVQELHDLTEKSFIPLYYFLGFFLLFIFIRLAAFNRSLLVELIKLLHSRTIFISLLVCSLIALGVTYGLYVYTLNLMKEEVGTRLMSIAATAAPEIDAKDFNELHVEDDMKKDVYQRIFRKLNEIRNGNQNVAWVYVMRPTEDKNIWEFVADADSNYGIPRLGKDINGDGVIDEADASVAPGVKYDATGQQMVRDGMVKANYEWVTDQWGLTLSAYAPIRGQVGKSVAILGVDFSVKNFQGEISGKFTPVLWFIYSFLAISILWILVLSVGAKPRKTVTFISLA